jgi:cell fate (sporulation/competence/biofilm development) regulator YlbF (YheA/YmcA/DUF963 family)
LVSVYIKSVVCYSGCIRFKEELVLPNMYDSAYDLENAIRESEEFKGLKEAFEAVMNDASAKKMFDDFRNTQLELQQKQMQGMDISEEEIEKARQVVELVQQHEDISKLMEQEQRLNQVINEISQIITKPLEELYGTQQG